MDWEPPELISDWTKWELQKTTLCSCPQSRSEEALEGLCVLFSFFFFFHLLFWAPQVDHGLYLVKYVNSTVMIIYLEEKHWTSARPDLSPDLINWLIQRTFRASNVFQPQSCPQGADSPHASCLWRLTPPPCRKPYVCICRRTSYVLVCPVVLRIQLGCVSEYFTVKCFVSKCLPYQVTISISPKFVKCLHTNSPAKQNSALQLYLCSKLATCMKLEGKLREILKFVPNTSVKSNDKTGLLST